MALGCFDILPNFDPRVCDSSLATASHCCIAFDTSWVHDVIAVEYTARLVACNLHCDLCMNPSQGHQIPDRAPSETV